jgi:predicted CXXCH cytochrome family protein
MSRRPTRSTNPRRPEWFRSGAAFSIPMLTVALLGVVAGGARAEDVVTAAGECAGCHFAEAAAAAETGGHAPILACISCHADARPGRVGRGHRTRPACTSHHVVEGHPPRGRRRRRAQRNCLRCHSPHGSTNLALVRPRIRHRRRLRPIEFLNASGAAPGGFTHPDDPGSGLCETCHRKTSYYRRNGSGEEHFTASCTACHRHEIGFRAVASDENCAICHPDQGARFEKPSGHSSRLACSECHAEVSATIGPGHRAIAACADCHDNATHAPTGPPGQACETCHEPHGTDNRTLVVEEIEVTQGGIRPIVFTNLSGRADGSFASESAPGTGLCEVCHTTTRYYRADGTGDPHFEFSCLPCHLHEDGFLPR